MRKLFGGALIRVAMAAEYTSFTVDVVRSDGSETATCPLFTGNSMSDDEELLHSFHLWLLFPPATFSYDPRWKTKFKNQQLNQKEKGVKNDVKFYLLGHLESIFCELQVISANFQSHPFENSKCLESLDWS